MGLLASATLGEAEDVLERLGVRHRQQRAVGAELGLQRVVLADQLGGVAERQLAGGEREQRPRDRVLAPRLLELRGQAGHVGDVGAHHRDQVAGLAHREQLARLVEADLQPRGELGDEQRVEVGEVRRGRGLERGGESADVGQRAAVVERRGGLDLEGGRGPGQGDHGARDRSDRREHGVAQLVGGLARRQHLGRLAGQRGQRDAGLGQELGRRHRAEAPAGDRQPERGDQLQVAAHGVGLEPAHRQERAVGGGGELLELVELGLRAREIAGGDQRQHVGGGGRGGGLEPRAGHQPKRGGALAGGAELLGGGQIVEGAARELADHRRHRARGRQLEVLGPAVFQEALPHVVLRVEGGHHGRRQRHLLDGDRHRPRQRLAGEQLERGVDIGDLHRHGAAALGELDQVDVLAGDRVLRQPHADRIAEALLALGDRGLELLRDAADRPDGAVGVDDAGHGDVGGDGAPEQRRQVARGHEARRRRAVDAARGRRGEGQIGQVLAEHVSGDQRRGPHPGAPARAEAARHVLEDADADLAGARGRGGQLDRAEAAGGGARAGDDVERVDRDLALAGGQRHHRRAAGAVGAEDERRVAALGVGAEGQRPHLGRAAGAGPGRRLGRGGRRRTGEQHDADERDPHAAMVPRRRNLRRADGRASIARCRARCRSIARSSCSSITARSSAASRPTPSTATAAIWGAWPGSSRRAAGPASTRSPRSISPIISPRWPPPGSRRGPGPGRWWRCAASAATWSARSGSTPIPAGSSTRRAPRRGRRWCWARPRSRGSWRRRCAPRRGACATPRCSSSCTPPACACRSWSASRWPTSTCAAATSGSPARARRPAWCRWAARPAPRSRPTSPPCARAGSARPASRRCFSPSGGGP